MPHISGWFDKGKISPLRSFPRKIAVLEFVSWVGRLHCRDSRFAVCWSRGGIRTSHTSGSRR